VSVHTIGSPRVFQYAKGILGDEQSLLSRSSARFGQQRKLIDESTVNQALLELQDEAAG